MVILDIETYKSDNESYLNFKKGKVKPPVFTDPNIIQAPSNYKDPAKIADYIANKQMEVLRTNEVAKIEYVEKIKEEEKKFALSPMTGRVILVGLMTDSETVASEIQAEKYMETGFSYRALGFGGENERELLIKTMEVLERIFRSQDYEFLVTYNGKRFDLPFLIYRSLIYNIDKPFSMPNITELLNPYNNVYHIDLFDNTVNGRLTEWSFICGDTNELDANGGDIFNMFEAGEYQKIIDKNKIDCFQTGLLCKRLRKWYGKY